MLVNPAAARLLETPTYARLEHVKTRPLIVTHAVRTALCDAVAWRIGGGGAPNTAAFVAAAVAAARLLLDRDGAESFGVSRTLGLVQRTAKSFAVSALGRRLMKVPASQFLRVQHVARGADVVVRDRRRRLHAIVLTARADAFEAGRIASAVAAVTPLPAAGRLTPLAVHVFSLATGSRHSFQRDIARATPDERRERVA